MSSDGLHNLSDQIGDLTPPTPTQTAAALAAAMRAAHEREAADRFDALLRRAGDAK